MTKNKHDEKYILKTLQLARKGIFSVHPNPAVGAIIVKNNRIIGSGYHSSPGTNHAEQIALQKAGKKSKNATLYVNLEPCCHYGRTPPCVDSIIKMNIKRVVIAQKDPNPLVNGKSINKLKRNGIEVKVGVLKKDALHFNKKFNHFYTNKLPYVTSKIGMSLDGKVATNNNKSKWITSTKSRDDVQKERALSSSILSTSSTIIKDNPELNVRNRKYLSKIITQPPLLILDRNLKIPLSYKVFKNKQRQIFIFTNKTSNIYPDNVTIVKTPVINKKLDFRFILKYVASKNINNIFVESGPILLTYLIKHNLVDEYLFYIAPKLLGDKSKAFNSISSIKKLSQKINYHIKYTELIDNDLKMILVR